VVRLTGRLAGKPSYFGRLETIRCAAERFSVRSSSFEKLCLLKSQSPLHMILVIVRRNQCPKTCIHAWHIWDSLDLQPIAIFASISFSAIRQDLTEVILSSSVVDKRKNVLFFSLFQRIPRVSGMQILQKGGIEETDWINKTSELAFRIYHCHFSHVAQYFQSLKAFNFCSCCKHLSTQQP